MLSIDGATKNALQWVCFANILLITWFNWYKFIIIQKIECTYLPYICRSSTEVINQSARVRWKKIHMHHSFIIEPRKSCKQWQWNVDNILSLYGEYVTGHRLLTKTKDSSLVKFRSLQCVISTEKRQVWENWINTCINRIRKTVA